MKKEQRRHEHATSNFQLHREQRQFVLSFVVFVIFFLDCHEALQLPPRPPVPGPRRRNIPRTLLSKLSRPIHNFFWTNTLPDLSYSQPLPPGPLGCPFRGLNAKESSPSFGPGVLFFRLFEQLKRPTVYKFFSQNRGIAVVSGYAVSKAVLSQEFDTLASQVVPFTSKVVGTHSLRCAQDKKEHTTLRKLIGMAVQPANVCRLIPHIQETAEVLIKEALQQQPLTTDTPTIDVEELCIKYTLEVSCRHIIGLRDLPPDEVDYFLSQVRTWIGALYLGPKDTTTWMEARNYLVGKIEEKIDFLEREGPDTSTVSGMLFAKDPDDATERRLSKDEIVDNTLLLILAGTETSASTLTNCLLLLGLSNQRKDQSNRTSAWIEIVDEQNRILNQNNQSSDLNRAILDQCTFLDGVVREALRLKPIIGGSMRGTKTTIIADGYQIPAGWGVAYDRYNTHVMDPITFKEDLSHMNIIQGFDPTRWQSSSGEEIKAHHNRRPGQEWIPFGVGPRYCLGSDLALIEMKIFLAVLARKMDNFEMVCPVVQDLDLASDVRWREKAIIPIPADGVVIRPTRTVKKLALKDREWDFERIYKINKRLGCAE